MYLLLCSPGVYFIVPVTMIGGFSTSEHLEKRRPGPTQDWYSEATVYSYHIIHNESDDQDRGMYETL